ncbi:MAG TPA: glycosyltransferase family 39 protein [Verrucomicrobiae bacterium]|nr:glycosyltransferase family 39 protein [Verrucomicrobiae bacterium]
MTAPASQLSTKRGLELLARFVRAPQLLLALAVLAALCPFLSKPLNGDDPLFVWTARHIQQHPANPFGFDVNWYDTTSPMWEVTKNPPLASYYLALAGSLLGWTEPALHGALLIPALAAILGTHRLARRFTKRPLLAAAATLATPVFVVTSTTLMCDTLMLAFWVWAAVLWVEGLDANSSRQLIGSALLVALAALTKYFAIGLIPLLAAYSWIPDKQRLMPKRKAAFSGLLLLIPVAIVSAYEWATRAHYGMGLLSEAAHYALTTRVLGVAGLSNGLMTLDFTGACLATASFLALLLWRNRPLMGISAAVLIVIGVLFAGNRMLKPYDELSSPGAVQFQIIAWAIGGSGILALAILDVWRNRDSGAWFLALWILGTFAFAGFFNWIVNARSILPMAPAVGILMARQLERGRQPTDRAWSFRNWGLGNWAGKSVWLCVIASAGLSLWTARSDFLFAKASREIAGQAWNKYARSEHTLWFEGHWGFQYYMEKFGGNARAVVAQHSAPRPGDYLAIPLNNSNIAMPNTNFWHPSEILSLPGPRWLATTSKEVGAGFQASVWGPLPFGFGPVPPERVLVYVIRPPTLPIPAGSP